MNFKAIKLRCVPGECILVDPDLKEHRYVGFLSDQIIFAIIHGKGELEAYYQKDIKDWTIKKPKRDIIGLYKTTTSFGFTILINIQGRRINYDLMKLKDTSLEDRLFFVSHMEKDPHEIVYADTLEPVPYQETLKKLSLKELQSKEDVHVKYNQYY